MRKIFTLYCFCLVLSFNDPLNAQVKEDNCPCKAPYICGMMRSHIKKNDSTYTVSRSHYTVNPYCNPVFMAYGKLLKYGEIFQINPDNIKSITILKGNEAAVLFGCEGMYHGVIMIQMIKAQQQKPIMKDSIHKKDFNNISYVKVFPNPIPSGSNLNIELKQTEEGYYDLQLLNQSGQSIHQEEIWIDAEARLLNIEVPSVAAGTYFLALTNKRSGKRVTEKIIIQ